MVKNKGAFTIIELVVCITIFSVMTALVVAKYGNFNQSVLLTDLAYDTAITVRTAQTYGLSVQNSQVGSNSFSYGYGVDFCANASGCNGPTGITIANIQLVLFADTDVNGSTFGDGKYDNSDIQESLYTITRGAIVSGFCFSDGCSSPDSGVYTRLDITFKRPNPDAVINAYNSSGWTPKPYAAILIKGTDGSLRQVIVRGTGQVSVQE